MLQGEVDRLHALLTDVVRGQQRGGQGTMVIHTGRSSWAVYVYPAVGAGLVYAYCRCANIWQAAVGRRFGHCFTAWRGMGITPELQCMRGMIWA